MIYQYNKTVLCLQVNTKKVNIEKLFFSIWKFCKKFEKFQKIKKILCNILTIRFTISRSLFTSKHICNINRLFALYEWSDFSHAWSTFYWSMWSDDFVQTCEVYDDKNIICNQIFWVD